MRSARIGERDFIWGALTYVMGIVNVTPDSFSGDGVMDLESAVAQARQMEQDGADLIDIGGESTRPETWAGPGLSAEEELARVIPVVERVAAAVAVPVSIDTYKAEVAERAVVAGARLVNDVWGLRRDPRDLAIDEVVEHQVSDAEHGLLADELERIFEIEHGATTGLFAVLLPPLTDTGRAGSGMT